MRINHKHFVYIISLPELASLEKKTNRLVDNFLVDAIFGLWSLSYGIERANV